MLTTIIYSLITNYDSKEINLYLLDFGAETLTMFRNAPHVGDVLLSNDTEKISNLFKMVSSIMEERKKIFVDYNGNYDFYINHGGKQIPMIAIVINNVEAFFELYEEYEDIISQMTRDCLKAGIVFILSTNGTNTIRYKIRQNFKQNIALQFNDPSDYSNVIPGARRKEPSKAYGRGLIELESIYEFQTAYPYREEKLADFVKVVCSKLNNICEFKAKAIPILPDIITTESIAPALKEFTSIPVGIEKDSLEIATINLRTPVYCITGEDVTSVSSFISSIVALISTIPAKCIVFDALSLIKDENNENIVYDSGRCELAIDELERYVNEGGNGRLACFMIGISSLLAKLESEEKAKLVSIIEKLEQTDNNKIIIVDNIDGIKGVAYENWFKTGVDLSEGIWIGNNISNQFTFKVTTNSRILRAEINPGFGYVIKRGSAVLTKFLSE